MAERNGSRAGLTRRKALALGAGLLATALANEARATDPVRTRARIVIAGGGAAGLAMANRLNDALEGAEITIYDAREAHYYQPGFTLVGAGVKPRDYPVSRTADYVPRGVTWVPEAVAEIDPEARRITTTSGKSSGYDFLVVSTGLTLDYAAIEGMDRSLIGREGIGSIYAGPDAAFATYEAMTHFVETGGVGLFGRPETEMKCAGAPLKYTFITEDRLTRAGTRGAAKMIYCAHSGALFSVPIVSEKVRMLFAQRGIATNYDHVLKAIDPGRRVATYATPEGDRELGYDFIHVIPPMRAPDAVRYSPLAWQSGPFAADGWVEVDKHSLRHIRYPEVFAVGDSAGVPKGKTAASVKWQAPVATDHIVAEISGRTSEASYNGYTSCPLITRIGRALLVEFDYENDLTPSFPGIIAPLEELWISWVMKETALKPTYLAMLRGKA